MSGVMHELPAWRRPSESLTYYDNEVCARERHSLMEAVYDLLSTPMTLPGLSVELRDEWGDFSAAMLLSTVRALQRAGAIHRVAGEYRRAEAP